MIIIIVWYATVVFALLPYVWCFQVSQRSDIVVLCRLVGVFDKSKNKLHVYIYRVHSNEISRTCRQMNALEVQLLFTY